MVCALKNKIYRPIHVGFSDSLNMQVRGVYKCRTLTRANANTHTHAHTRARARAHTHMHSRTHARTHARTHTIHIHTHTREREREVGGWREKISKNQMEVKKKMFAKLPIIYY